MKNKITKFVSILLIIFISLFINQNKVEAKEFIECDYMAPLSYMDSNSMPSRIQFDFKYHEKYTRTWFYGLHTSYDSMVIDAPSVSIDSFCISKINSGTFNSDNDVSYDRYDYNGMYLAVVITPEIVNQNDANNIKQSRIAINYKFDNIPTSTYIKIYVEDSKLMVKSATKDEYQSYIKNNQYLPNSKSNQILNLQTITGLETRVNQVDGDKTNGIAPVYDDKSNLKKYIQSTGGIVLVNTSNPEAYPSSVWNKFIKEVKSSIVVVNTSPTIERIIDIKQESLYKEKTIIYPNSFKFTDRINF